MDPLYRVRSLLRRGHFDVCADTCDALLREDPHNDAAWYIRVRALTLAAYVDDLDVEDGALGDTLMDEHAIALAPRPGTSLLRPHGTAAAPGSVGGAYPSAGYARPGTSARPGTTSMKRLDATAFQGIRPASCRPLTSQKLGRPATSATPPFADPRRVAQNSALAKALCDFLVYHEHQPKEAMELAARVTVEAGYSDWWWKERLGKAYYQLGLLRDAEKQFQSSIRDQDMVASCLELAKVHVRLDQPNTALEFLLGALDHHLGDTDLLTSVARIYQGLGDKEKAIHYYKKVLESNSAHVEAIASLGAQHFADDQPELALRFYHRLLQAGLCTPEVWNNVGLCCFHTSHYDTALSCLQRSVSLASDDILADIWYNIGVVAINMGEMEMAYQAFTIAISANSNHGESYVNLGVIEMQRGNIDKARSQFAMARRIAPDLFEAQFNGAVISWRLGNLQESYELVTRALELLPDHSEGQALFRVVGRCFSLS